MHVGDAYVSRRTALLVLGGLSLLLIIAVAGLFSARVMPGGLSSAALALMTDVGSVLLGVVAAAALIFAGRRFRPGNPLRRIWLLLGAGIAAYAVGDIIWTVLDIRSGFGAVPYPSAADAFYLLMYVFVIAGLTQTAQAFGRVARIRKPMVAGIAVTLLASAVVYTYIALPVVADAATTLPQKVFGVAYPLGDMLMLLGPAVFILLAAPAIGPAHVTRQWWPLGIGLVVMSVSDITFTWLDWTGRYFAGHPVDFGWMLSLLLIAIAGSLAADATELHPAAADAGPAGGHDPDESPALEAEPEPEVASDRLVFTEPGFSAKRAVARV